MGKFSLLAVLALVGCSVVTSLSPPRPIRRMKTTFVPLKKQTPALQKGSMTSFSMTSRRCSVVRRHTYFQKMTLPFLCHPVTQRVIPWPRQKDPMTSMQMLKTMKAKGWVPCPRQMPVPMYKFQRIPVCCPGTVPTPFGSCIVRQTAPVQQQQQQQRSRQPPSIPRGQQRLMMLRSQAAKSLMERRRQQQKQQQQQQQQQRQQLLKTPRTIKGPVVRVKGSLGNLRPLASAPRSSAAKAAAKPSPLPLFPMLWKTPRPYRGLPSPALLRKLANRKVAPALRTPTAGRRVQKAPPVIAKPRPALPMPKPLPPRAFLMPLLTGLMLKSQTAKPSAKKPLLQTPRAAKPGLPASSSNSKSLASASPSPSSQAKARLLAAASLMSKPLSAAKPSRKPLPPSPKALLSKSRRLGLGPVFGSTPRPVGPLLQRRLMAEILPRVRGLPPKAMASRSSRPGFAKPMVEGSFPRALLDDLLFAPGPLSGGGAGAVSQGLKDLLDELIFGSVVSRPTFQAPPLLPKGVGPLGARVRLPALMSGVRGPLSNVLPPMFRPPMSPLTNLNPAMLLNRGPLSLVRPPFVPAAAALLSNGKTIPRPVPMASLFNLNANGVRRPPTVQELLMSNSRPPMMPPSGGLLSKVRPPMSATSSLTAGADKSATMADFLSRVLSAMIVSELLSQNNNNNNNNNPQAQKATSSGPTFSNNNNNNNMLFPRPPAFQPFLGPLSNVPAPSASLSSPPSPPPQTNTAPSSSSSSRPTFVSLAASGAGRFQGSPPLSQKQQVPKSRPVLSEWQKDMASYLAAMMYAKLQVEQQHKTLRAEVDRHNILNRQMELLLAQQILKSHQRRQQQQQQQMQDDQALLQQQQQQQQEQMLQEQVEEEAAAAGQEMEQPDVIFQEPEILDSRPMPVLTPTEDLEPTTAPPNPVLNEEGLPDLPEMEAEMGMEMEMGQPQEEMVQEEEGEGEMFTDQRLEDLPFGPGILDEVPVPRPPVFAGAIPAQGQEGGERQGVDVRQRVRDIVNSCLLKADIPGTMEQVLQTGDPANLRPICRKSGAVGPCVLAETQDTMGEDEAGLAGKQLIRAVLLALGQTCAKLEEVDKVMEIGNSETTSTPVFPNPPPEIIQEVVTELPVIEGQGDSPSTLGPTSGAEKEIVPPDVPEVVSPDVLMDSAVTPLSAKGPEQNEEAQPQKAQDVLEDSKVVLPLWIIIVIVGACAGILILMCACVCLVLRCQRKNADADAADSEPEKLPVPAEVTVTVAAPPAYRKSETDVGEADGSFKIPEDVGEK